MFWIVILFIIVAAAADYAVCSRAVRSGLTTARTGKALLAAMWATDMLPAAVMALYVCLPDNGTAAVKVSMWMMFAFLTTVVPRTAAWMFILSGRSRSAIAAGIVTAAAIAGTFIYAAFGWRDNLTVVRTEIRSERLPEEFDGFRIAQFSDLHIGSLVRTEREIGRIVDTLNSLDADLVVFTGDLVNIRHTELDGRVMRLLAGIEAPTISVTGNHDTGCYIKDTLSLPAEENLRMVFEKERRMGWIPLDDETVYIRRGGDSISVTGISFDRSLHEMRHSAVLPDTDISEAYAGTTGREFNITLVHIPQMWDAVTGSGRGDLTLSGHVHSMQAKARLFGRQFSPARIIYRRWSGLYGKDGRYLYINDGAGCVGVPMRIGARPEITLITLRR